MLFFTQKLEQLCQFYVHKPKRAQHSVYACVPFLILKIPPIRGDGESNGGLKSTSSVSGSKRRGSWGSREESVEDAGKQLLNW